MSGAEADALVVGHRIGADGPGAHLIDGVGGLVDDDVDLPCNEIVHRRRGAAIGDKLQLDAGGILEIETGDVAAGPQAGGSGRDRLGPGFQPGEQLVQRLRRHIVLADDDHGIARQHHDRLKIGDEVVAELVDRAICNVGTEVTEADRVAIGRRTHHPTDADRAARSRDVLDHERLAEHSLHAVAKDARHRVRRTACGERHHDGDRVRREVVRTHTRAERERCHQRRQNCSPHHPLPTPPRRKPPTTSRSRSACGDRACA